MSERYDVIVVGSGAGGGVVAGELARARAQRAADRGRPVQDGRRLHALGGAGDARDVVADRVRRAARRRRAAVLLFRGRCVGGTTAINTKVALRPTDQDYEKWHAAAGLLERPRRAVRRERDLLAASRAGRAAARRARARRLAAVRAHGRARLPRRSAPSSSRSCPTRTRTACAAARACRAARRTPARSTLNTYIQPAAGRRAARAARRLRRCARVSIEDRGDGPRGDGRRVPRRPTAGRGRWTPTSSWWRPARSRPRAC